MSGGKGWANPAPAGLVALAMACFIFYAFLSGKVDGTCIPLMGCWLLGGFIVQVIVGIIELMEGATTGGNVFTFFCAFFMFTGGLEMFVKFWAKVNNVVIDTRIDGWAWLALAIAIIMWTPAYLKESNFVMGILVMILDIGVLLVALIDIKFLDHHTFAPIAGTCLFITGILGLYISSAVILNTAFKKTILPVGGPILR